MLRNIIRSLAVRLGFIAKPVFEIRFMDRHPTPDQVQDGQIVVVRGVEHHKWACFRCPGGCGNRLQLSLVPTRRPRWTIRRDWLNRPSVHPSVLQTGACGAHFWIANGTVIWCEDSRCPKS
jgi:hypothetical protein